MNERVRNLAERVKEHLERVYGEGIMEVLLYGSHARGEADRDSDIDLLVLVKESLNPSEVRESLSDLLLDILLESGNLVSVVVVPVGLFETANYPFIMNVRRDGIRI